MKRMLTVLAYHMAKGHREAAAMVCAVISAAVSFTAQADGVQLPIIHKPAQAIANASAAGANPYTDANGATWGFFQRAIPAATGMGTALTAFTHTSSGMKGFDTNGGLPYVLANDTDHVWNPDHGTYKYVNGGALYFQPGSSRAGFYFQAPRSGFYDVDALFGAIPGWSPSNECKVDVSVVLDGAMLYLQDLKRNGSTLVSDRFVAQGLFMKAGQRLEFMVGQGVSESSYSSDATVLELTITEVTDVGDGAILIDVGQSFADNMKSASPVNPWLDTSGASISAYRAGMFRFDQTGSPLLFSERWTTEDGLSGFKNGTGWALPEFAVNINDSASELRSVAIGYGVYGSRPGEIYGHPDTNMGMLRCLVPSAGRYVVSVAARDVSSSGQNADTDGVNLSIVVDGDKVVTMRTSIENGPRANHMQYVTPIALAKGDAIDVFLDQNGGYSSDGTFMTVRIYRLPGDGKVADVWDIGATVNDKARADGSASFPSSFIDESGAGYSFGCFTAFGDVLSVYKNRTGNENLFGWCRDVGGTVQCVKANAKQEAVASDSLFVYPRELYLHPANQYTVIRFTAPFAGIYSIESQFRDINTYYEGGATDGVDCHVLVGGCPAKSAVVVSKSKSDSNPVGFNLDGLWLATGETVDFAVGANGGYSCDATTFKGVVRRTGAADKVVSSDFRVGGTVATFAGKGRYGCGNAVWTDADLTNVKTPRKWKFANGDKSNVTIVMSRRGGALVAASGTDNDLLKDGALSSGSGDVYDFVIAGLAPSATYSLCFYGTGDATWHIGDADHPVSEQWFAANAKNLVRVEASASADGTITGTFASSTSASAVFSGMQIAGGDFAAYEPYGLILVVQ